VGVVTKIALIKQFDSNERQGSWKQCYSCLGRKDYDTNYLTQ